MKGSTSPSEPTSKPAETVKEPAAVSAAKEPAKEGTTMAETTEPVEATKKAAEKAEKPVKSVELRLYLCGCGSPSKACLLLFHGNVPRPVEIEVAVLPPRSA